MLAYKIFWIWQFLKPYKNFSSCFLQTWWEIAALVLNTFQPVLRGETYRLFRWLKTVGIELASDDINHLPVTKMTPDPIQFYITRECLESNPKQNHANWIVRDNEEDHIQEKKIEGGHIYTHQNKSTLFYCYYSKGVFHVFQLKNSEKLNHLFTHKCRSRTELQNSQLFKSSLVCSREYRVNISRAELLRARLSKILNGSIQYSHKISTKDPMVLFWCRTDPCQPQWWPWIWWPRTSTWPRTGRVDKR